MFRRTFTILILFTLTPLLLLTMAYYLYQIYVIDSNFSASLAKQLDDTTYLISKMVEDKKRDVLSWSRMSIPEVCFEYDRPEAMEVFLNRMKETYGEFSHIAAYRSDKSLFATDSLTAQSPGSLPVHDEAQFSYSETSVTSVANAGANYLVVTAPINDNVGELLGFVSAFVSWDELEQLVRKNESVAQSKSFVHLETSFFDGEMNPLNDAANTLKESNIIKKSLDNPGRNIPFRTGWTEYEVMCVSNNYILSHGLITQCLHVKKSDVLASTFFVRNVAIIIAFISLGFVTLISIGITKRVNAPFTEIVALLNTYRRDEFELEADDKNCHKGDMDDFKQRIIHLINHLIETEASARRNEHLSAIGSSTAMVAHDVRKPLTSMKALLVSLTKIKDDPAELNKMISAVDRNIAHTNAMLEDILDFSRDSTALKLGKANPQGLVVSALSDVFRNHTKSRVNVIYDLKHSHTLECDSERIIRVLANIIGNGIEAVSGKDENCGVEIKVGTYETEREGKKVIGITIGDNGPGIPENVLPKLFDPFFTHGKKGGTGLGLAICQRIITLHGGKIEARNRKAASKVEGQQSGAEFIIELPAGEGFADVNESELIHNSNELKVFREEEARRIDYGDTANAAEFMRINKERGRESYLLIVDDEPLFRETVRGLFSDLGTVKDHVKIVESDSAEKGLEMFAAREFDYVIADIDLGKGRLNGYEFSQMILKKYPNTHVLIHSNKRRAELDKDVREIKSDKFIGFLPKPMRADELLQFLACKTFEADKSVIATVSEKKNVLILNDDDALLFSFKMLLKAPDVQVLTASNVSTALKHIAEQKVDVILSDVNLGEGEPDGYEFLKNVRETDKKIPFYMVSGYSAAEEGPKAKDLGANGYLQLPVDQKQLRDLI